MSIILPRKNHDRTPSRVFKCECVGKHIPKPLSLYRYNITPTHNILLCPTTYQNVHILWELYKEYDELDPPRRPPWSELNNYSEYARAVVERGREYERQQQHSNRSEDS